MTTSGRGGYYPLYPPPLCTLKFGTPAFGLASPKLLAKEWTFIKINLIYREAYRVTYGDSYLDNK